MIFVTSHTGLDFEVSSLELGAADFIAKPVSPGVVLARVKAQLRIKRMADELRHIASTDALTGIANRRRFDESLELVDGADRALYAAKHAGRDRACSLDMAEIDSIRPTNGIAHPLTNGAWQDGIRI